MHLSKISLALRQWGAGAGFSPLSLFASGEQGAWFDPSDLSTMFQDAAGATPVTAVGQPVGLILDKSKGLVLGAELVDIANTSASWVVYGTNTVSQDGDAVKITYVDAQTGAYCYFTAAGGLSQNLVSGKSYELRCQVKINSGSANIRLYATSLGNYESGPFTSTVYEDKVFRFSYSAGQPNIEFGNLGAGEIVWIRGISIKELPGNHASQATAAKRPLLQNDGVNNYLAFDGVDDALATANIDFSSTDKMSVFVGTYSTQPSGSGFIVETSTAVHSNDGAFAIIAGNLISGVSEYACRGTVNYVADDLTAPATNPSVQQITFAPSATPNTAQINVRVNGAIAATTVVAGTTAGNFGNWPMYLGARLGTSNYANYRAYSMIVLGRLATPQEITDTETWVNSKTGAY